MEPALVLANRYALQEELGRSRTGLVCRSHDPLLRRDVAVKLVHPQLADDPGFADALTAQARRVAALSVPANVHDGAEPYLYRLHIENLEGMIRAEREARARAEARLDEVGAQLAALAETARHAVEQARSAGQPLAEPA